MTEERLNNMFLRAKESSSKVSLDDVNKWVKSAAIASAGASSVGWLSKMNFFITKNMTMMIGGTITTIGIATITSLMVWGEHEEINNSSIPVDNNESLQSIPSLVVEKDLIKEENTTNTIAILDVDDPLKSIWTIDPISFKNVELEPYNHTQELAVVNGSYDEDMDNTYPITSFSEMEVKGYFEVILTQGMEEKVSIEIDEKAREYVLVENKGNKLIINNSVEKGAKKTKKMIVHVTLKDLKSLTAEGVGKIRSESQLNLDDLSIVVKSVGNVELDLKCNVLNLNHAGVGDIKLKGQSKQSEFTYSGVGNIEAFDLISEEVKVRHSGVGKTDVNATEKLSVTSSGIGSVNYKGNPADKQIQKNGIGSVKAK